MSFLAYTRATEQSDYHQFNNQGKKTLTHSLICRVKGFSWINY